MTGALATLTLIARPVDLVEHAAVGEMGCLRLFPAAEHLINGEKRDLREFIGVAASDLGIARPVEMLGDDFLGFGRIEQLQIGLGRGTGAMLVDDLVDQSDRRLGQNADRRRHDLEFVLAELIEYQKRLIFPGDQHIALTPLFKGNRRAAGAGVEDRDIAVECGDKVARFCFAAAGLAQSIAPSGEIDRKSTRLNSSHVEISYAVFCLKKKKK